MHLLALFLSAFVTTVAAADATSSLDFHLATGSSGLQAQLTSNIREGLHATVNWDAAGVTGNALVTVGPATVTLNKNGGQPLRVDVAGLSVVSPFPLPEKPSQPHLVAARVRFAAAPSAGARREWAPQSWAARKPVPAPAMGRGTAPWEGLAQPVEDVVQEQPRSRPGLHQICWR